jgi:phosphoribosylformylglycinamidine synthase
LAERNRNVTVRTLVLTGFGINCEHETAHAFSLAGAEPTLAHLNDLIANPTPLETHHILAIPGGFSFGDDVASGRILANRLRYTLGEPLRRFVAEGKLAIGICNGFQVLVKMGLLPLSGENGDCPRRATEGSETGQSPFFTHDTSPANRDSPALAEPRLGQSPFSQEVTLTHNDSGRFEDRWVTLEVDPATPCSMG